MNRLHDLLSRQPSLVLLPQIQLRHVEAIYASPQHLFAIASYRSEAELLQNWSRAAHMLAFKVQRNMPLALDALRWDMYLLLVVEAEQVSAEVQKLIENNRFYFRKIVLSRDELEEEAVLCDRLPLLFQEDQLEVAEERASTLWFEERHFLQKLAESVGEEQVEQLGADFFLKGARDRDELLARLGESVQAGGERGATAGD